MRLSRQQRAAGQSQQLGTETEAAFDAVARLWSRQGDGYFFQTFPQIVQKKDGSRRYKYTPDGYIDFVGVLQGVPCAFEIKGTRRGNYKPSDLPKKEFRRLLNYARNGGFAAVLVCEYEQVIIPHWYMVRILKTDKKMPKRDPDSKKPRWLDLKKDGLMSLKDHVPDRYEWPMIDKDWLIKYT